MIKDRKVFIILILLIILTSLVKLNPLTMSAQMYIDNLEIRSEYVNIRPFSTIKEYIVNANRYNTNIILKFFMVNTILYLPIALFLGIKNFNKFKSIVLLIILPIILDLLQLILRVGVFDIDSVMLNISSSIIIFLITGYLAKKIMTGG